MPTIKEIEETVAKLKSAIIESIDANKAEVDAKFRKSKAHYRLQKAKEAVRNIEIDSNTATIEQKP